jgi:hypothetical protein
MNFNYLWAFWAKLYFKNQSKNAPSRLKNICPPWAKDEKTIEYFINC